jgi:hypothetical protein
MRGYYTSIQQNDDDESSPPKNYYDDSFRLIKEGGMNHVRYVYYWESYEKNPSLFKEELSDVAQAADKWGIKVLYDNHQFLTSSYFNPDRGTGFPNFLFENNSKYQKNEGGHANHDSAKLWWTDWWNRKIKDSNGTDGWIRQAEFLKEIVKLVDNHSSTLGYEILNEPQVHKVDQWAKIGQYNTFMTNELRDITQKTIVYSWALPFDLKSPINVTPQNIAKMTPENKTNVVFKISVYSLPESNTYQRDKVNMLAATSKLAGVQLYIGEWNNVVREKNEDGIYELDKEKSNLSQEQAIQFLKDFDKLGVWGWAYWIWNYEDHSIPNFNIIKLNDDGEIKTTKYYDRLKNAISTMKG